VTVCRLGTAPAAALPLLRRSACLAVVAAAVAAALAAARARAKAGSAGVPAEATLLLISN